MALLIDFQVAPLVRGEYHLLNPKKELYRTMHIPSNYDRNSTYLKRAYLRKSHSLFVSRIARDSPAALSINITFKTTGERDTAQAILEASNLRGDQRHVDVKFYGKSVHRNVLS